MKDRKTKPLWIRLLGTVSAFTIIGACLYMYFVSANLVSGLVLLAALGGLSGPVVISGGTEGVLDCLIGILEAFIEGVFGVFGMIAEAMTSLFG